VSFFHTDTTSDWKRNSSARELTRRGTGWTTEIYGWLPTGKIRFFCQAQRSTLGLAQPLFQLVPTAFSPG